MRVPVVGIRGIPLMPCKPVKARFLLKEGKAKPKRNKLGLFSIQLTYEQEPDNQTLVPSGTSRREDKQTSNPPQEE